MTEFPNVDESVYAFPSLPGLPLSLQLINTEQHLQPSSTLSIPHEDSSAYPHYEEASIELELPCKVNARPTFASTTQIRKKKTGCTCKKTQCLKMYCECFAAGRQCTEECGCHDCCNHAGNSREVEKRREGIMSKAGNHKGRRTGCRCKKSQCQKKYCECFSAGVACSDACRCEGCANGGCSTHQTE